MTTASDEPYVEQDRAVPHDLAAEQSVLGSMMLSADVLGDVIDVLTAGDFYRPSHASLFDVITDEFAEGRPVDPIALGDALRRAGKLDECGGLPYLHTLISVVPTAVNAAYHAEIVRDLAVRRRLIMAGTRITQFGYTPGGDDTMLDRASAELDVVAGRVISNDFAFVEDTAWEVFDDIEAIQRGEKRDLGLQTGLLDLDFMLGGLQAGQLIVLAGRPGMGKSNLGLGFLRHATIKADPPVPGVLFSLEMGRQELVQRLFAAEGGVALKKLTAGGLTETDWSRLEAAVHRVAAAPLIIDDSANLSMTEIRAKARRLKQRHNIGLLVVDYLQLMQSGRRVESRQQEVADISRALKLLAKDLDLPVVAISQLNRGPEQRGDKRPHMSDLRESGAIEQDADVIVLVHREDYYEKESNRAGEADLIIAKQRNGPTGDVPVHAALHLARFNDLERHAGG